MNKHYLPTILLTISLAVLFGVTTIAKEKSRSVGPRSSAQSEQQPGQVVIRRIPNLGNNVIVSVFVDGSPYASVEYGQTFKGSLPAGRHTLSVEATPRPTYAVRTDIPIDVQSGETYIFTAEDSGSGNLVLK